MDLEPTFLAPLENITAVQGRDAVFTCVADNLGDYRVSKREDFEEVTLCCPITPINPSHLPLWYFPGGLDQIGLKGHPCPAHSHGGGELQALGHPQRTQYVEVAHFTCPAERLG